MKILVSVKSLALAWSLFGWIPLVLSVGTLSCKPTSISDKTYSLLETVSKLVAISYCVGREGIQAPFSCLNHCSDFPTLELLQTWDTGVLTNSCGYIAIQKNETYKPWVLVIFRGTSSFANFISDLRTAPTRYSPYPGQGDRSCINCTVHEGFMSAWNVARRVILPQLKILRSRNPEYRFMLAGHSLGGAVAGLAATELAAEGTWKDIHVITFGEPMFANDYMADYINYIFSNNRSMALGNRHTYWRVTNTADPVPNLPPRSWGWQDHDQHISINGDGIKPDRKSVTSCGSISYQRPLLAPSHDGIIPLQRFAVSNGQAQSKSILAVQHLRSLRATTNGWDSVFAHRKYFTRMGLCFDPDWIDSIEY